jgi:hypothetical protein
LVILGGLISNHSDTAATIHVYSLVLAVIFILMSGLFTVEGMPVWAQNITLLVPFAILLK